jgi:hypothetical protein
MHDKAPLTRFHFGYIPGVFFVPIGASEEMTVPYVGSLKLRSGFG